MSGIADVFQSAIRETWEDRSRYGKNRQVDGHRAQGVMDLHLLDDEGLDLDHTPSVERKPLKSDPEAR